MGIEGIGYTKVHPDLIFKDRAILFENAIVFTKEIDQFAVDNDFPQKQANDLKLYDEFGKKTNELVDYLRKNGFSAQASPPTVGFVTYPSLAQSAGLGWKGKSNLLITPELRPRQKISAIFTSIENLPINEYNEHSWMSDYCNNCGKCIRTCPRNAIVEKSAKFNVSGFIPELCKGCTDICTICMKECPFNKREYSHLKSRLEKNQLVNNKY
jgi:epoxyqueuosine reductase QueG